MDLKRKRGEDSDDVDTLQFSMHARHSWLANNSSVMKMPWDFNMVDQFDIVHKSGRELLKTVGTMPPLPAFEGTSEEHSDEPKRYGTMDPSFGVKAVQNAHKRSWQD